jgi:hypothetical protein
LSSGLVKNKNNINKLYKETIMDKDDQAFNEITDEAVKESNEPENDGKAQGIIGIIIGVVGLFSPFFLPVIAGIFSAIFGVYTNRKGNRSLGIACGVLSLINLLIFFIFTIGPFKFI